MKRILLSLLLSLCFFTPAMSEISLQSYTQNSDLVDDYIDMARLYTSNAQYDKALEYIDIIEKISPNNPKILYEKAVIYKNYNQPILARNLIQEIARTNPEYKETYLYKDFFKDDIPGFYMPKDYNADYYKKRGEDAYKEGKYEKALEYFKKASQLKKSVDNYNNLGKAYLKTNNPKYALKCFELAINLDIKNPQAYINLAEYYCEAENNSAKQLHYLKHAIKLNPDLAETYYQIGDIYLNKGNYETAAEYYRMATAKDDLLFSAYFALGSTLFKMQDFEEAYLVFEKSLNVELDNPKVYEYLAKSAIELRRYDKALSYIERAVSIEPTPDNYLLLAKSLYFNENYDASIKILNTKLANSGNAEMYNYLGLNYFQKNEYNKALNYLLKAVNLREKPIYYYNIAQCYNIAGDRLNTQEYIKKALNTIPKNPQDYIYIANIYLEQNETIEALNTLTKAISLYPNERGLYKYKLNLLQKTGNLKDYNTLSSQYNSKFPKETVYLGK